MWNDSGHQGKTQQTGSEKKVNGTTYNISSIKRVTREFLEVSRCRRAKQRQRNEQEKCAARAKLLLIRPAVFVTVAAWTLRNHDDDGNGNVKKQYVLLAKEQLCTCITLFCTFHCLHYETTTWNDQILSLLGNGNGKAINSTISVRTWARSTLFSSRVWARIWSLGDNLSPWLKFWGTFSFLGGQKFVHPSFLARLLIGLGRKSQISRDF